MSTAGFEEFESYLPAVRAVLDEGAEPVAGSRRSNRPQRVFAVVFFAFFGAGRVAIVPLT